MRIVYENKFTELDESEAAEKKRFEVRLSVGGFGFERESVIEMLADISDKVIELALNGEEVEPEEVTEEIEVDSLHDKFKTERKGWFK